MRRYCGLGRVLAPLSRFCFAAFVILSHPLGAEVVPVRPALHWAAENGLLDIASLLIEQGADPDETDHFGNTALHLALPYPDMIQLLLDSGADVNAKNAMGNTALHLAVDDRQAAETLLAAGAEVNALNGLNKTPLHYAMRQGTSPYNLSIVEMLIRAGAR
jgi:ankyrin repeat protein